LGALSRPQLPPHDDTDLDTGFASFAAHLRHAVRQRDDEALISMTEPQVMLGFGGSGGHATLRLWLQHPETANVYWRGLEQMLQLGSVRMGADVFCLPYTSCLDHKLVANDPYAVLIVTGPDTPLLERPTTDARALRTLDDDVVQRAELSGMEDDRFQRVQVHDGEIGYIDRTALRSPLDLRMEVVRGESGWRIRSVVGGD